MQDGFERSISDLDQGSANFDHSRRPAYQRDEREQRKRGKAVVENDGLVQLPGIGRFRKSADEPQIFRVLVLIHVPEAEPIPFLEQAGQEYFPIFGNAGIRQSPILVANGRIGHPDAAILDRPDAAAMKFDFCA